MEQGHRTCVVALGQAGDEVVGSHLAGSCCHLHPAAAPQPIGDVGVERAGKEQRLLGDHSHLQWEEQWGHSGDVAVEVMGMAGDVSGTPEDMAGDLAGTLGNTMVMAGDPDIW